MIDPRTISVALEASCRRVSGLGDAGEERGDRRAVADRQVQRRRRRRMAASLSRLCGSMRRSATSSTIRATRIDAPGSPSARRTSARSDTHAVGARGIGEQAHRFARDVVRGESPAESARARSAGPQSSSACRTTARGRTVGRSRRSTATVRRRSPWADRAAPSARSPFPTR